MSSNSIVDLQKIVVVIGSICLFLWFDDFVDIELSHFEQNLFVFDSCGNIQALCLKPFGKSDAGWIHLFLWNDEECPEFCPVSILLCYVHCAGIKGGFLFLSEEGLKNPPDNGVFVTQLSYSIRLNTKSRSYLN